jgi:hypothetical protein
MAPAAGVALYDKLGLRKAYRKLIDRLWSSDLDWASSPIQLQSTKTPLVRELRRIFRKAVSVAGMRLGGPNDWRRLGRRGLCVPCPIACLALGAGLPRRHRPKSTHLFL